MSHRANKLLKSAFPDGSSNDYTPVVIRKRTATSRKPASGYVRSHEAKVEEKASTGNTSLKKFTPAFVRRVIAARASLKLKQKELNAKLAFPTNTIKLLEARKLPFKSSVKRKLSSWLDRVER